jgi:hypothetical protein
LNRGRWKAWDSIRVHCEFDSNESDESDSHHAKLDNAINGSISQGIPICSDLEKLRISKVFEKNLRFPDLIQQFDKLVQENAEASMTQTVRGITIGFSDGNENASDSIRVNRECDSNKTNRSESCDENHHDPRLSTLRAITIE